MNCYRTRCNFLLDVDRTFLSGSLWSRSNVGFHNFKFKLKSYSMLPRAATRVNKHDLYKCLSSASRHEHIEVTCTNLVFLAAESSSKSIWYRSGKRLQVFTGWVCCVTRIVMVTLVWLNRYMRWQVRFWKREVSTTTNKHACLSNLVSGLWTLVAETTQANDSWKQNFKCKPHPNTGTNPHNMMSTTTRDNFNSFSYDTST